MRGAAVVGMGMDMQCVFISMFVCPSCVIFHSRSELNTEVAPHSPSAQPPNSLWHTLPLSHRHPPFVAFFLYNFFLLRSLPHAMTSITFLHFCHLTPSFVLSHHLLQCLFPAPLTVPLPSLLIRAICSRGRQSVLMMDSTVLYAGRVGTVLEPAMPVYLCKPGERSWYLC